MKTRLICISFALTTILMVANACSERPEITYDEKDVPQFTLFSDVYYEFVSDALRAVEITSVFDSYQAIRTDRAAGLALVQKSFQERELFYDKLSTVQCWEVVLDPENNLYYSNFWHGFSCLTLEAEPVYEACRDELGDLVFRGVSTEDHNNPKEGFSASFKGRMDNGRTEVYDLDFRFRSTRDRYSLTARTLQGEVLYSPSVTPVKGHRYYPESGTLLIEYNPESQPAVFAYDRILPGAMSLKVSFHGDSFTIEDGQGFKQDFNATPTVFCIDEY